MEQYSALGLMSGTSLDGLDIAYCEFTRSEDRWEYRILHAETVPYTVEWCERLAGVENSTALELAFTDTDYGHFLGRQSAAFIRRHGLSPGLIASHGHTIFHRPERRMTLQIGKGSAIAAETGLPVVTDFRSLDVALGGQGAPLVPIGDEILFSHMEWCLNLGGFANISFREEGSRIAFDICPVNIVLNHYARKLGRSFDPEGQSARSGMVDQDLLSQLNLLAFYDMPPPKSLGKEWVLSHIFPILENCGRATEDILATFCEHVAHQAGRIVKKEPGGNILVTGGGAFNKYLVERIACRVSAKMVIPDEMTINYKEALIFAFLGVLRACGAVNSLSSVTGASGDSSGGSVTGGKLIL